MAVALGADTEVLLSADILDRRLALYRTCADRPLYRLAENHAHRHCQRRWYSRRVARKSKGRGHGPNTSRRQLEITQTRHANSRCHAPQAA